MGEWLKEEKGCQDNEYFHGYTIDTPISDQDLPNQKKTDVVGVRYEETENKTPSFKFHFHIVKVKSGKEPEKMQNVMGEIDSIKYYVEEGNLAADTVSYYVALPGLEIPKDVRRWAKKDGVGLIALETSEEEDEVVVREILNAKTVDLGFKRNDIISNKSQQSPGNFRKRVSRTDILKKIMEPKQFFDEEIRPKKEAYTKERNYQKSFSYINNRDAREAMKVLVNYLETFDNITVRPKKSSGIVKDSPLYVDFEKERKLLKIKPIRRKFKIFDSNGEMIFRISSKDEFDVSKDGIESLSDLKSHIAEEILSND